MCFVDYPISHIFSSWPSKIIRIVDTASGYLVYEWNSIQWEYVQLFDAGYCAFKTGIGFEGDAWYDMWGWLTIEMPNVAARDIVSKGDFECKRPVEIPDNIGFKFELKNTNQNSGSIFIHIDYK